VNSEIISIGTELLLGNITDTNASYIAAEFPSLGIDLYWISQVGDNKARLTEVLRRAWQRSDLIITTGGLGPTEDDITRETIAEMLGENITIAQAVVQQIEERFKRYGRRMSPSNVKQAGIIASATAIPNSRGTAPGWWVEKEGHILIALPGPPGEMHHLWQTWVRPRLSRLSSSEIIVARTIKLWGLSESGVNELCLPLFPSTNPTLGIYVKADGIHLRLTAKASSEEIAAEIIKPSQDKIFSILDEHIWGTDSNTLEDVAIKLLTQKNLSLSVMEGFTGGLVANTLSDSHFTSAVFKGSIVITSEESLKSYGVSTGPLTDKHPDYSETALDMARTASQQFKTNVGLSNVRTTGEDPGSEKAADIIHIGITIGEHEKAVRISRPRDRARTKRWVTSASLFALIKMLRSSNYFSGEIS
jgi:nicotinamide-nucleotide amidase